MPRPQPPAFKKTLRAIAALFCAWAYLAVGWYLLSEGAKPGTRAEKITASLFLLLPVLFFLAALLVRYRKGFLITGVFLFLLQMIILALPRGDEPGQPLPHLLGTSLIFFMLLTGISLWPYSVRQHARTL